MFGKKDSKEEWFENFEKHIDEEYFRWRRDIEDTVKHLSITTVVKLLMIKHLDTIMEEIYNDMTHAVDPKEAAIKILTKLKK